MAEDTVVPSSEMDPESADFKAMLAGISTPKESAKVVEKVAAVTPDVKAVVKDAPSSDAPPEADQADESVEALQAKVKGLKAELSRKSGQQSKVEHLEQELERVKQAIPKTEDTSAEGKLRAAIEKLDEDGLIDKEVEWQDEQTDARLAIRQAERDGDVSAQQEATKRLANARTVLKALSKGRTSFAERRTVVKTHEKEFVKNLEGEVSEIVTTAYELHPDVRDSNSALFKAGNAEYMKRPYLMEAMGQTMGEIVSLAYAVLRNPDLIGGSGKKSGSADGGAGARKELLKNLDEVTGKAFLKSGGAPGKAAHQDYGNMVEGGNLAEFEKQVAKIKGG